MVSIALVTGVVFAIASLTLTDAQSKLFLLLAFITQLNDYQGTLEPYLTGSEVKQSYISCSMLFKNVVLIFALVNLLPETRYRASNHAKVMYAFYEAIMPTILALLICVPVMLLTK